MYLSRVWCSSFGRLSGECHFSRERCNVLCDANESGKSTLVDAILFSLYNFPTARARGSELKAKDKYKPWFGGNGSGPSFLVEVDLMDVDGRNLRLRSNFARQQPFELQDLRSGKPVPLEGGTFGRRFLRLPLNGFTECFFFRQDERPVEDRDDLMQMIEEAAVSNRSHQDASVRVALGALDNCKIHLSEFSAGAVLPSTLLKSMDAKIAEEQARLDALESEVRRQEHEIASAAQYDAQVEQLGRLQIRLEYQTLLAEMREIESSLKRYDEAKAAAKQRQERMQELEGFKRYDVSLRPRIEAAYAASCAAAEQLANTERRIREECHPALERADHVLGMYPAALRSATRDDLDRLRSLRITLEEQRQAVEQQKQECDRIRGELTADGVDVSQAAVPGFSAKIPPSDCSFLINFDTERANALQELSEAERLHSEATEAAGKAKLRREKRKNASGYLFAGTAICAVATLGFALMNVLIVAIPLFLAAVGLGIYGINIGRGVEQISTQELEPALATEIAAAREVKKTREGTEQLQKRFDTMLSQHGLGQNDIQAIRDGAQWAQKIAPLRAAEDYLARLEETAAQARMNAHVTVAPSFPDVSAAQVDEIFLQSAIAQMDKYLMDAAQRDQALAEVERARNDATLAQDAAAARERELEEILAPAGLKDGTLDSRVQEYLNGIEQAVRLEMLKQSGETSFPVTRESLPELKNRARNLAERLQDYEQRHREIVRGADDVTALPGELREQLDSCNREREGLRLRRGQLFHECDRAMEACRREGPELRARIDALRAKRAEIANFQEAVQIARAELERISGHVFSQWATALSGRVNEILRELTPRYRDVEFTDELEVSLFSEEVGRRLLAREMQHLSKGARDQLAMAVRVAVSEYLSAHLGPIPLVFDEPFAHWDDKRFVDGMRFLATLARRHQVIVLSCHGLRYRELERSNPEIIRDLNFCSFEERAPVKTPEHV